MRVVHRLAVALEYRSMFLQAGIDLKDYVNEKYPDASVVVIVDEEDIRWPIVKTYIEGADVFDIVDTRFTDEELRSASYLSVLSLYFKGYPEPSDDRGYLDITFDLTDYCDRCGCRRRLKSAPLLGVLPV